MTNLTINADMPGICVETALLPVNDKISYYSVLMSANLTPKQHLEQYARLDGIVQRCFVKGRLHHSLTVKRLIPRKQLNGIFAPGYLHYIYIYIYYML